MANIVQTLLDWLQAVLTFLLQLLPDSPFTFESASQFRQVMGYINYFIPVGKMIAVFSAWLIAVAIYYSVSAVLRMVKAVE